MLPRVKLDAGMIAAAAEVLPERYAEL